MADLNILDTDKVKDDGIERDNSQANLIPSTDDDKVQQPGLDLGKDLVDIDAQQYGTSKGEAAQSPVNIDTQKFPISEKAKAPMQAVKAAKVAPMVVKQGKAAHPSRRDLHYDEQDSGDSSAEEEGYDWVKDSMQYLNTEGFETKVKPNERFKNYKDVFNNLVVSENIKTMFPMVSAAIAFDSQAVITITKASEREYWVKMYSLKTYKQVFGEKFGGGPNQYIKMKEIAQNAEGNKYAMAYFDDGRFLLRTFARTDRTEEEIAKNEVCFNDLLGLDANTMPVQNFPDPFITVCFINDNLLFVQLVYSPTCTHHHLFWDIEKHAIVGKPYSQAMIGSSSRNFPYKCFYNEEDDEVYAFYRQGEFFNIPVTVNVEKKKVIENARCTDMSLGDMYLVFNKLLVARSSQEIVFFKMDQDENDPHRMWKQFYTLPHKGFLFFIKGNIRIQITTDEKIYFYLIDPITLIPNLENVMYNYMNCNQTMFGKRVRFCVTYKTNMKSFDVYRRKYQQNYKVPVNTDNLEGASLLELESANQFIVTMRDKVTFYDMGTFKEVDSLPISLFKSETREITQVLAIQKCQNEEYLAVISGKKFIKDRTQPNQLFIFKKIAGTSQYEQKFRVVVRDIEIFKKVCMNFHFVKEDGHERHKIMFSKIDCVFTLDFTTEAVEVIHKYDKELLNQPSHFETDDSQTMFSVSNKQQSILIDMKRNNEMSINDEYQLELYQTVKYDSESNSLYIIANRLEGQLGFYILNISIQDPYPGGSNSFVLKWKRSLEIGDCAINILRDPIHGYKEIVITYKTIFINVYTIMVIDQNHESGQPLMYRHESFQLWESQCNGTLLHGTNEFIAVNRDGINVFALGSIQKRPIQDVAGDMRMMNSLESMNYLKLDPTNVLVFANQNMAKREVQVFQVIQDKSKGGEIEYKDLYKVKVNTITLRELLLIQSIYVCSTQKAIVDLVRDQPQPTVFYKTFLELNGSNMASILSFDSRSMSYLLSDKFENLFQAEYPIFYKNKIDKGKHVKQKFCYRNALDTAVNFDQNRACERIITYLCKYQNNFISHYLFLKNLHMIVEKGINISDLLRSDILNYQFDFDKWPSQHTDDNKYLRPYNGSIFDLQFAYDKIFHEESFKDLIGGVDDLNAEAEAGDGKKVDSSRVYKIAYTINLIPSFGQHVNIFEKNGKQHRHLDKADIPLMEILAESDEFDMFTTDAMQNYIDFKWTKVGRNHHAFGAMLHLIYLIYLCYYVNDIYINASYQNKLEKETNAENVKSLVFIIAVLYPFVYESVQCFQIGIIDYITDLQNLQTVIFVGTGVMNGFIHYTSNPYSLAAKVIMVCNVIFSLQRSLEMMRIMEIFSPIVTMMTGVLAEFADFILFFVILLAFLSMGLSVLQIDNPIISKQYREDIQSSGGFGYAGSEYQFINGSIRNFFIVLRLSTGDNNVLSALNYLEAPYNQLFWAYWVFTVLIVAIIFLNFVITKACAAYDKISERLNEFILRDRANMIAEADSMKPRMMKNLNNYPKYFVVREVQN